MSKIQTLPIAFLVLLGVGACTDSRRAQRDVKWADRPAEITCWTYGQETFSGRSTGKVEYDEGGRVSFVDAANGRFTTIEGDCRVVYAKPDEAPRQSP